MSDNLSDLNEFDLSKEQLIDLFKISFSVIGLARHDLVANSIAPFAAFLERLSEELRELSQESSGTSEIKDLIRRLPALAAEMDKARQSVLDLMRLFNKYFWEYRGFELYDHVVSRPLEIVESIKHLHNQTEILIASDSPTLEIIYPRNILFGILSELITNAVAHTKDDGKVLIQWRIQGTKFQCEVHDSGPGLVPTIGRSFFPLDAISNRTDLQLGERGGLATVNRVLVLSKGILLFSNSQILGGTLVQFEFPVFGHH